jgi:hypothetical protein
MLSFYGVGWQWPFLGESLCAFREVVNDITAGVNGANGRHGYPAGCEDGGYQNVTRVIADPRFPVGLESDSIDYDRL